MSQTLMAFLAMMIAALAAINQYTAQIQSYDEAYRTEFEMMANALALEQMEVIDMTTDFDDLENWDGDALTRTYEVWNGDLEYRETDRYFMIQQRQDQQLILDADAATGTDRGVAAGETVSPATLDTRQIEIKAVLFELNHTKAKDSGVDWSVLFGSTGSTGGGQQSGGQGSDNQVSFFLQTKDAFSGFEDIVDAPDQIDFKNLNSLFRLAENVGVGETIATPSVTVQSGPKGDIQIGSDVPVQIRDTFGNISTQYFKTGIIIEVTPTLIEQSLADTLGSPTAEFLHLEVKVEKSGSRPSASGPAIDRSLANT